jgi:hypothetical protein
VPETRDRLAIHELLTAYANSFDRKDWAGLGECLADTLHTDYSQLRHTPPETISREHFVELRQSALHELDTQHLLSNYPGTSERGSGRSHRLDGHFQARRYG